MEILSDDEFPALFRAADHRAVTGQRRLLATTGLRLTCLVLAATFGAFSLDIAKVDAAAVVAATALASALVIEVYLLTAMPDRQWAEARAAAESAKSLTWRYVAGGDPFARRSHDEHSADTLLLKELTTIARDLHNFAPIPLSDDDAQVTDGMRRMRGQPLDERRRQYIAGRIDDQRSWYRAKASANERRASQWSVTMAGLEALGLVTAVLNGAQVLNLDLPGIVGALGAAGIAWMQTRQHRQLAGSYSVAALELGDVVSRASWPATEEEWARFVDETENVISREHSLWRTSHN
ncbi:DUF4231 domain-containing protein [Microbispora sp. RL4-1S]|uniref:DUF4231 domain-containing protein n=1 Tax=Microbispora oryzae TaxID=2806554 RepID=A0A941AJC1_9ACTN|nr:DUF4231 domain-containing protein [Microbispora oryzae]MBP2704053.1 DUF4231 domain-containing protein [Microbispora oryzae]